MKKILLYLSLHFISFYAFAQKEVFAFTISDYIVASSDSISIVQLYLPFDRISIKESQAVVLKHNYSNSQDTLAIGWGRCQLIKGGQYYYFGIHLYNKKVLPKQNDLLYTMIEYNGSYKGLFYKLIKNAIYFERVGSGKFYDLEEGLLMDIDKEQRMLDSLVADIRYTGQVMQEQNNSQDRVIKGGLYDGKKLFATMQAITREDVKKFIGYVIARPTKYAGNTWKISETFATWMTSGSPTVARD